MGDFWETAFKTMVTTNVKLSGKVIDLKKENEILKECVEFYAMASSWGGDSRLGSDIDESDCTYIEKWNESIGGKRARSALEKIKALDKKETQWS